MATIEQTSAGESSELVPVARPAISEALTHYVASVRADFELMRRGRAKYLGDAIGARALPREVVKRIGLQMMVAIRTMHLLRDVGLTPGALIASRLIRHVYGAEIHWESQWEPGINLVHGNGLVVGRGARVRRGCVLLHNVTLGDAFDAVSGSIGGPTLEENVHVGPGCTLLGPIKVGAGSKLMAGAVLDRSVPPRSLVRPCSSLVTTRDDPS